MGGPFLLSQTGSLSAPAIEAAVVDELRCIVDDEGLKREVYRQAEQLVEKREATLELQLRQFGSQLARDRLELGRMVTEGTAGELNDLRRDDLNARIEKCESRLARLNDELTKSRELRIERKDVDAALGDFDRLWELLRPRERVQLLELLIERVQYDSNEGTLEVEYHPTAIAALIEHAEEVA